MVQQVKNKQKLYKYKVILDYYYIDYETRYFTVWAYNEDDAIKLVSYKGVNLYPYQLRLMANIKVHKNHIHSFFARLFNKVPKEPICTEIQ